MGRRTEIITGSLPARKISTSVVVEVHPLGLSGFGARDRGRDLGVIYRAGSVSASVPRWLGTVVDSSLVSSEKGRLGEPGIRQKDVDCRHDQREGLVGGVVRRVGKFSIESRLGGLEQRIAWRFRRVGLRCLLLVRSGKARASTVSLTFDTDVLHQFEVGISKVILVESRSQGLSRGS